MADAAAERANAFAMPDGVEMIVVFQRVSTAMKILQRLWKQEQRNKENVDNMDDDSLCKICMDSPVRIG